VSARSRVLLAITVYNGRAFVGDALRSAAAISTANHDLDVLVLDDHSPDPGWSAELARLCADLDIRYYCSPRNLGIPRNVNLGLLTAQAEGYTHVVIANSDVLFPANLVDAMVPACESEERIASVTAWSNNASIYSIPNDDAARFLATQEVVDWLSSVLGDAHGAEVFDAPAGISFCIMIPLWAVNEVGLMDPVFGRGYCEETDWSRRSLAMGYRCTVAKGVFVYHAGKGSNESAGLIRPGATTVDEHELIVDMRYPTFRDEVGWYMASGTLERHHDEAVYAICRAAAREHGYAVEVSYLASGTSHPELPTVIIDPSGAAPITCQYLGFRADLDVPGEIAAEDIATRIREFGGGAPTGVNLLDRGPRTQHLLDAFGVADATRPSYPTRV
jgi:GT2 family glycosyltransferase